MTLSQLEGTAVWPVERILVIPEGAATLTGDGTIRVVELLDADDLGCGGEDEESGGEEAGWRFHDNGADAERGGTCGGIFPGEEGGAGGDSSALCQGLRTMRRSAALQDPESGCRLTCRDALECRGNSGARVPARLAKERRCMIAEANGRSMGGLKCTFMGFSFSSADAFRRSLIENGLLLPHGVPKRGGPGWQPRCFWQAPRISSAHPEFQGGEIRGASPCCSSIGVGENAFPFLLGSITGVDLDKTNPPVGRPGLPLISMHFLLPRLFLLPDPLRPRRMRRSRSPSRPDGTGGTTYSFSQPALDSAASRGAGAVQQLPAGVAARDVRPGGRWRPRVQRNFRHLRPHRAVSGCEVGLPSTM